MAFTAFAVTAPGLEQLAAGELKALGVGTGVPVPGGVQFEGTEADLATSLLQLRTATRVIVRIAEFRATSFAQLERRAESVDWPAYVAAGARVSLRVTCRKSRLYHSDAVAQRVAAAIAASVPGVVMIKASDNDDDDGGPAQMFIVRITHDVCSVSADAAGDSLHRRGYRQAVGKAPLRETLAAAMLVGAGWDGTSALYDPFCGSGTLVIEAALMARGVAPGLRRAFAAERWPPANLAVWEDARSRGEAAISNTPLPPFSGSDRDAGAIEAARANAARAGVEADVTFTVAAVSDVRAPAATGLETGLLITNPPYGSRTGDLDTLRNLYARLGVVARREFPSWRLALLSADRTPGHTLERQLGIPLTPVWRSLNGGIPVRLLTGDIPG